VGFPPHSLSPAELDALRTVERKGAPFLGYRDGAGALRLPVLDGDQLTVGREDGNDIVLGWDAEVSRTHAQIARVGTTWTLVDDGLSRNGCFVNGDRVQGRRRLEDGDMVRLGRTTLLFRTPGPRVDSTLNARAGDLVPLTPAERRVLVELCRPLFGGAVAAPASNDEIGARLYLSRASVKTHIRALFAKLEIEDLPQNRKRAALARSALETGLVSERELRATHQ
jgi:pSer/pThr/pTyr-binding forkhead associated (FHA) protein